MKKKMFISLIVLAVVALTAVNLNMEMSIQGINSMKLSAAESFADDEVGLGTPGMRLESYICRQGDKWREGIDVISHQRICETFTRYSSFCNKADEEECHDEMPGVGSGWNNPDQTWKSRP